MVLLSLLFCSFVSGVVWAVVFVPGQDGPDDPGRLVGHRDGCKSDGFSCEQVKCPWADPFRVGFGLPQSRSHADDQKAPDVPISHPLPGRGLRHAIAREGGDAPQLFLAPAGSVEWCQPEPGRKLPTTLELPGIADRGDNGGRRDRADTRYCSKQHHAGILLGLKPHPHLVPSDPQVQSDQLIAEIGQDVNGNLRNAREVPRQNALGKLHGAANALGDHDAELRQETAQHVAELRALANDQITGPVQEQDALLLFRLDRDEPHRRACHGFADCLRIGRIGSAGK